MSKQSGLGDNFYIGGYDLSGDVASLDNIDGTVKDLDVTSIKKSAHERVGGQRDGMMEFTTWYDTAAGSEHPILSTLPRADTVATYFRGTTLGNAAASVNSKQLNYDITRGGDGSLSAKVSCQANAYGLEWGEQLTAGLHTDTTATGGTAVNDGTSSTFGGQGYVQVTALTAPTNFGVRIEQSATGTSSWTTIVDFGIFGAISQYVRATSYGTSFTSATFAVQWSRNPVTITF
jgi:hypothetical protein